jgi:hypothetical protein
MKMFFAGAENTSVMRALHDAGVKRILLSYYYIRRRGADLNEVLRLFPEVIIDSGAFTMLEGQKGYAVDLYAHEKYLHEYLDFLEKYIGKFFWVANYDIDSIVGHRQVVEWNTYFEALEKGGQTVCYVAHDMGRTMSMTTEYIERYSYVGSSAAVDVQRMPFRERFFAMARAHKVRTHGFGFTSFVSEQRFPFFTCDSTTYLGGARYGSTYIFNGAFFETIDFRHKHYRKWMTHWCRQWGIDERKFFADDQTEVLKFNIRMWLENERHFNRKTWPRQWWITDDERQHYQTARYFQSEIQEGTSQRDNPRSALSDS